MLIRFIQDSIRRAPRRKALIIAAIAMGSAVATSMLGVMLSIGDKVNKELRQAGANIVVTAPPAGGAGIDIPNYIPQSELPKLKTIFWALNITGVSPSLAAQEGQTQIQGVDFEGLRAVNPAWIVQGHWPNADPNQCMIGEGVAVKRHLSTDAGITVLGAPFKIAGIIHSGDEADDRILIPLARIQQLTNRPGVIDRIDVAALTKPEDTFARKDPRTMTAKEYDRWACTSYVTSIAHNIEEALPGTQARPVRRIADSEGKILDHIGGLMGLITLAALLSAGLTVWSLTATTMMERRGEIAIMQAIGGSRWIVATLLALEIALIGIAGGLIGALTGVWLAKYVGASVFHDAIDISPILPFAIMLAAMLVALAGAAQPLRRTLNLDPAAVLREGV
jgi:putative ABC transport system permease protein